jgi:MraZ protein
MFLGEFEHTIDDKGRLTIPAKFRARLAGGLVITKGIDRCLGLYPPDVWERLAQKISALPQTNPKAREFRRQMFGSASDDVPDRQGRVNLPQYLRGYAQIDRQVVIVGLCDHCEIWDLAQWRERQEAADSDLDARMEQFASLDI